MHTLVHKGGWAILCLMAGLASAACTPARKTSIPPLLDKHGVAALLPAMPAAPSADFDAGHTPDFTIAGSDNLRMLTTPGQIRVRRPPGSRVFLAGSAEGTAAIAIDDVLLIEISAPEQATSTKIVAGPVADARYRDQMLENRAPETPIRAGAVDLSNLLPACTERMISVVALDAGGMAAHDAVYLVMAPKPHNPFGPPLGPVHCSGRFAR